MVEEGAIITSKNDKKWKILHKIGSGKCCNVFEGLGLHDHSQVAIKVYNEGNQFDCAHQREYLLLKIVAEKCGAVPQLVSVRDDCSYGNQQVLVEEYLEPSLPGILFTIKQQADSLSLYLIHRILTDITSGLSTLHQCGFIHADIKPDNILWCPQTGCFKLIDFGLAFHKNDKEVGLVQCTSYRAPEVYRHHQSSILANTAIDVWSLGVLVLYLVTGEKLTNHQKQTGTCPNCQNGEEDCENNEIVEKLFSGSARNGEAYIRVLLDLAKRCLQCKPNTRPQTSEISVLLASQPHFNASYMDSLLLSSKVLRLLNMVEETEIQDSEELEDIKEDIVNECRKFGEVLNCLIPTTGQAVGKVYVCFSSHSDAKAAYSRLNGRTFNNRTVLTTYLPLADYQQHHLY
ncbi:hypothetical protein LOTGIDRAFT_156290 [Lottia gigantea]|uniref:Protein kinase domain-containing protein n=1 Tax=Lottia gigantea TaxID=225164 RepID=V4B3R5_LOTGI|nr:hypothetical protein LOTGIDRAFT_156290 [Lottia gigantea]ESP05033.1 hypothetical protein LOTGIDRAFT_156290 [Lottia gigantea]